MKGKLFDDIGFIGDTECADQNLNSTYVLPPDTDPATKFLLDEAGLTFRKMLKEQVATYVITEDFQDYWQTANKHTLLSYSGLHFGHYEAASFNKVLSAMHAVERLQSPILKGLLPKSRFARICS